MIYKNRFRWSDIDANRHIRNTAYNDMFIEARLAILRHFGMDQKAFAQHGVGPMVIHEHLYYIKEIQSDEEFVIDLYLKGLSIDGKYVQFAQHLYMESGEISCYMHLSFAWLDIHKRKLTIPPQIILDGMEKLTKSDDFNIIDSSALKADGVPYGKKYLKS